MNILLPIDYQNYASGQTMSGTEQARVDNANRPAIGPVQHNSSPQKQTSENSGQSNSQLNQQFHPSKDKVSLSKSGLSKHAEEAKNKDANDDQQIELSEDEEKEVQELKDRDREVRIHEQAHAAVGGQYAGSPSYEFESGPDGKRYAVGGEVSIDVSEEKEPEDTLQKMQIVRAAALAPAEPSSQDLKVAAEASQKEQQARAQISQSQLDTEDTTLDTKVNETNSTFTEQQAKLAKSFADSSTSRENSQFSASA